MHGHMNVNHNYFRVLIKMKFISYKFRLTCNRAVFKQ